MENITPQELQKWMDENRPFFLLDVREDFERVEFNIGGFHISMNENSQLKDFISNSDKPIVVYCAKGIRSAIVLQRYAEFCNVPIYNLTGGMQAWQTIFTTK